MPEGHTLHRLARDQAPLVGRTVRASSPQGRFEDGAGFLDGRRVDGVEAYGKHLLHRYDDRWLHVHLGLRGFFRHLVEQPLPPPWGQVRLRLDAGNEAWDLIAPTRCEVLDPDQRDALLARLGPDPLRPDADPEEVWRRLSATRRPVGVVLLDQSVVAGIGNVIRTEVLAACGISPHRPAVEVTRADFDRLWGCTTAILRRALEAGRIVTVDGVDDATVDEADARYVYKQELCRRCSTPVVTGDLAGRTAYHCPSCQPS